MKTQPSKKWKFAIGTTSRVPHSGGSHYLIADFDEHDVEYAMNTLVQWEDIRNIIWQRTPNGWHLYTDGIAQFETILFRLDILGADSTWIDIGRKRGYWFLADKDFIYFPWPVEHMVIQHGKKETHNSKTS